MFFPFLFFSSAEQKKITLFFPLKAMKPKNIDKNCKTFKTSNKPKGGGVSVESEKKNNHKN